MKNGVNDSFFSYKQLGLKRVFVTSYKVQCYGNVL